MAKFKILRILFIFVLVAGLTSGLSAQPDVEARSAMQSLYKIYDSTDFITFDVRYHFYTDTVFGDFHKEEMSGTYTMSGRNAKFSMNEVEYLQNDSFFVAVYNKEKMIMVGNSRMANAGSYMPMREAIDSVLNAYSAHYNITVQNNESNPEGYIQFSRADTIATFDKFLIQFDTQHKYLTGITYVFDEISEIGEDTDSTATRQITHKRILTIDFLNYRFDNFEEDHYNENKYFWNDEGELKPTMKYTGYKIYNSR